MLKLCLALSSSNKSWETENPGYSTLTANMLSFSRCDPGLQTNMVHDGRWKAVNGRHVMMVASH